MNLQSLIASNGKASWIGHGSRIKKFAWALVLTVLRWLFSSKCLLETVLNFKKTKKTEATMVRATFLKLNSTQPFFTGARPLISTSSFCDRVGRHPKPIQWSRNKRMRKRVKSQDLRIPMPPLPLPMLQMAMLMRWMMAKTTLLWSVKLEESPAKMLVSQKRLKPLQQKLYKLTMEQLPSKKSRRLV